MKMQNIFIKTILVGFFVMIGCQNSFPLTVIHDNEGTVRHNDEPKMQANNYYVSSTGRTADFDRLYGKYIGDRISDVNPMTFNPGDTIRFYGSVTDEVIDNPGIGSCSRPIVFMGLGPNNGRAVIKGIILSNTKNVEFLNFESASPMIQIRTVNNSTDSVRFVKFRNCYLHDGVQGIAITIPTASDITFEDTVIDQMDQDGILLSDGAGDRFTFIGGSITNTGKVNPGWHVHGCYASGGSGHLFDGVEFKNNVGGYSISIRRGGITIRNCTFVGYNTGINNNNEDEVTGVNHYTGSRARNQYYKLYRNMFVDSRVAIYQGGFLNNGQDLGCEDPGNAWAVFNNTFVNTLLNFGETTDNLKAPAYYDIYLRNNAFVNTKVVVSDANADRTHELSNNGWSGSSSFEGGATQKGSGISDDPMLDDRDRVTGVSYRNAGTQLIAPAKAIRDMESVVMVCDSSNPLYYCDGNPDIGREEY
jgi:hypothetical protein